MVGPAQAAYQATETQLQQTFDGQKAAAQVFYNFTVGLATAARTSAFSSAQSTYDAANLVIQQYASGMRQTAMNDYNTKMNELDATYQSDIRTVRNNMQCPPYGIRTLIAKATKPSGRKVLRKRGSLPNVGLRRASFAAQRSNKSSDKLLRHICENCVAPRVSAWRHASWLRRRSCLPVAQA